MSKPKKKKMVVTKREQPDAKKQKPSSTGSKRVASRAGSRGTASVRQELIFGRSNYLFMGLGVALVAIGLLLMSGGSMPSPEVWEPQVIYSGRRTVLAPLVILSGFGVVVYAIFKS
jgi:hypothetical protein